jgi:hypothetical protein
VDYFIAMLANKFLGWNTYRIGEGFVDPENQIVGIYGAIISSWNRRLPAILPAARIMASSACLRSIMAWASASHLSNETDATETSDCIKYRSL